MKMLVFNFASRTLLTKDLRKVLTDRCLHLSFMPECLDSVVKADHCAQNVDDIAIGVKTATQLTLNTRAVFRCIPQAGMKLTKTVTFWGQKG